MTRPWGADAEALQATEGDYADFAGWEVWMSTNGYDDVLELLETVDRVQLYALCCALWDHEWLPRGK